MKEKHSTMPEDNQEQSVGNKHRTQTECQTDGVTIESRYGGEFRVKNAKPADPTKWKKQKRISMIVALSVMFLLVAAFLLKCTAVSP